MRKAFEVGAGTGELGPELSVPSGERKDDELGRGAAVRAAWGGIAGESAIKLWCLFLPDQGN